MESESLCQNFYMCSKCNDLFSSLPALDKHNLIHESGSESAKYEPDEIIFDKSKGRAEFQVSHIEKKSSFVHENAYQLSPKEDHSSTNDARRVLNKQIADENSRIFKREDEITGVIKYEAGETIEVAQEITRPNENSEYIKTEPEEVHGYINEINTQDSYRQSERNSGKLGEIGIKIENEIIVNEYITDSEQRSSNHEKIEDEDGITSKDCNSKQAKVNRYVGPLSDKFSTHMKNEDEKFIEVDNSKDGHLQEKSNIAINCDDKVDDRGPLNLYYCGMQKLLKSPHILNDRCTPPLHKEMGSVGIDNDSDLCRKVNKPFHIAQLQRKLCNDQKNANSHIISEIIAEDFGNTRLCRFCKNLIKTGSFEDHLKFCRQELLETCTYSNEGFYDCDYKAHIQKHLEQNQRTFTMKYAIRNGFEKCKFCEAVLPANTRYDHILNCHQNETLLKKCDLCLKVFLTESEYEKHTKHEHQDKGHVNLSNRLSNAENKKGASAFLAPKLTLLQDNETAPNHIESPKTDNGTVAIKAHNTRDIEANVDTQGGNKKHARIELSGEVNKNEFNSEIQCSWDEKSISQKVKASVFRKQKTNEEDMENMNGNGRDSSVVEQMTEATSTDGLGKTVIRKRKMNIATETMCKLCKKQFASVRDLELHTSTHCTFCDVILSPSISKYSHVKRCHPDEMNLIQCKVKEMTESAEEESQIYNFQCCLCKKCFENAATLKQHMDIHSETKSHVCEICNASFFGLTSFYKHKRIHKKETVFKCELCAKSFTTLRYLKRHQFRHVNSLPFFCNLCRKRFKTMALLKKHVAICQDPKVRKYSCNICGGRFKKKSYWKNHMTALHGEKQFMCEICCKMFSRKAYLKSHMATHQLFHQCKKCGDKFDTLPMLKKHKDSAHDTQKKLVCDICEKIFFDEKLLTKHVARHMGDDTDSHTYW